MHVCLVADRFGRDKPSGVGVYVDQIITHMTQEAADVRFTGLAFRERSVPRIPERKNLCYRQIPGDHRAARALWSLANGPRVERSVGKPSITHALLPLPVATRGPWVATVHDITPLTFPSQYDLPHRALFALAMRAIVRRGAHVIASSRKTAEDLERHCGLPSSRITVVHLGVDAEKVELDEGARAALIARFGLSRRFVSFLGQITRRKNLVMLVRAFGRVARTIPDVDLVLAGQDGFGADEVRDAIQAEGLGARVHLPGYVSRQDAQALMAASEAFVFPSTYEGFGFPPLEAMVQGTPVVTVAGGSLPEVVGDAALLSHPEDVDALASNLVRVLSDPSLRASLRERGTAWVGRFTWARTARETLATYEKLL